MENQNEVYKETKSISDIYSDSFKVLKENWSIYLIAFIVASVLGGAISGFRFVSNSNSALEILLTIVNAIVSAIMTIIYIGTTSNTIGKGNVRKIGELISENVWKLLLTQFILFLIFSVPAFIVIFAVIMLISTTGAIGMIMPLMMVFMLAVFILVLKLMFVPHSVVLSDKNYWNALKWSWQKTKGQVGKIFIISLTPALFGIVAFILLRMDMMNLFVMIVLGVLGGIVGVIVSIAYAVLYLDVVDTPEQIDNTESKLFTLSDNTQM